MGRAQVEHPMDGEIWYFSFERLSDHGGGLGTYMRQVVRAAKAESRAIRVFQPRHPKGKPGHSTDGPITIVDVETTPAIETAKTLGHWMNLSRVLSDAALAERAAGHVPVMIEIPDGFALGYFLLQRKLTGEPALATVPIVLCAHTPIAIIEDWIGNACDRLPEWWTYRAEKWCFKAADAIITLSDMMETELRDRGYLDPETPVFRALNPYLPDPQVTTPREPGRVVGMASRMVNWKGLREVLLCAQRAEAEGLDLSFELCGDTHPDFERARQDFAPLFTSGRVRYLGTLDEAALAEQRRRWLCQLHPSRKDNLPYAVLEALASGTPCLIGPGNGVAEILPPDLRPQLVVDFADSGNVLKQIAALDPVSVTSYDLGAHGSVAYFARRTGIARQAGQTARGLFPFVNAIQARSGLRPTDPIAASARNSRITAVVPYYNMQGYIDPCIASLRNSSIPVDIIIVNDGSTDARARDALVRYRDAADIRIFDVPNGGVARARNFGVTQAQTEFVALLDADDTIEAEYYRKAIEVLDRYDNVGFVGCWANDFADGSGETIRYWPTYNAEPMPNLVMNNTNCQALIYRRTLYEAHGQHDPALRMYLDDWDGVLGMLENGCFGVMLPEALFNYRQRSGSIFQAGRSLWHRNYAYILRKRQRLAARNAVEMALFLNANGPNENPNLLGFPPVMGPMGLNSVSGRLPLLRRLARSIAKRLLRFAARR